MSRKVVTQGEWWDGVRSGWSRPSRGGTESNGGWKTVHETTTSATLKPKGRAVSSEERQDSGGSVRTEVWNRIENGGRTCRGLGGDWCREKSGGCDSEQGGSSGVQTLAV